MDFELAQVKCHSSYTYAQSPLSFICGGREYIVKAVEKEWLEPSEKHFRIQTIDDIVFELCYYETSDLWLACKLMLKS